MSKKQVSKLERKIERLTAQSIKLMDRLHKLELTFSRLKNEGEELLRELLIARDGHD